MTNSVAANVYVIAESLLSVHISIFNLIVLWVYLTTQHVRTITNTYIFSLALTDFLVGFIGIPSTVYTVLTHRPHSFLPCLAIHSTLCVLCTISTFHLLAIAIDKYISICCKSQFMQQTSRYQQAVVLISTAWIFGMFISIGPLIWLTDFYQNYDFFSGECSFTAVIDYHYLVYVIFIGTIILPNLIIIYCYASIYNRIRDEDQQIKCFLRACDRQRRIRDRKKLISILLLLVSTYGICWYPLYIINTINLLFSNKYSNQILTMCAVVLSHVSCVINPLIYAYGVPGFKQALRSFIRNNFVNFDHKLNSKYRSSPLSFEPNNSPKYSFMKSPINIIHLSSKYPTFSYGTCNNQRSITPRKLSELSSHASLRGI